MAKDQEALEFAGFKDAGVSSGKDRDDGNATTVSGKQEQPKETKSLTSAPETSSRSGAGALIGSLVGVGCIIALIAISDSPGDRPGTRAPAAPAPRAIQETTLPDTPVAVKPSEQQPPVGVEILTLAQLRWCVFWDWRIKQLAEIVTDDPMFPAFNKLVDDYGSRCFNASYYEPDMGAVQKELARYEVELAASVADLYRGWSQKYLVPVVLDIQRSLTQLGYEPGPVDGLIGPRTRNAIRQIERDHGVEQTGQVSIGLRDALRRLTAQP